RSLSRRLLLRSRALAPLAAAAQVGIERIDEVAEHVKPRVPDLLAGRLERRSRLALLVGIDAAVGAEARLFEDRLGGEDPDARTHRQGQRIGRSRVDLDGLAVEL